MRGGDREFGCIRNALPFDHRMGESEPFNACNPSTQIALPQSYDMREFEYSAVDEMERIIYYGIQRNANFDNQRNAWDAEFTREPQRECEFWAPAKRLKRRIHQGTAARMRILSAREVLENSTLL